MVFNRPTLDIIPAHRRLSAPEWQKAAGILKKRAIRARELRPQHYNCSTRPLPTLRSKRRHPASQFQTLVNPGVIVEVSAIRDYLVKTPASRLFRRNRPFLRLHSPAVVPNRQIAKIAKN